MIRRPPRSTQSRSSQRQMCIRDRRYSSWSGLFLRQACCAASTSAQRKARRSLLGELSSPLAVGRVAHDGVKAGGANYVASATESLGVADLSQDGGAENRSDPEDLA